MGLLSGLSIAFLGMSFLISAWVKNQEIALGSAFFLWLALLAFVDILLIGVMMQSGMNPGTIYAVALLNPMQVFRVGAIALFDPELSVIGPAAYFILDTFGRTFFALYSLLYPVALGALLAGAGYWVFKRQDLV